MHHSDCISYILLGGCLDLISGCLSVCDVCQGGHLSIEVVTLLVIYFNHCSAFYFRALLSSAEAPWEEGGSEADR